MSFSPTKKNAHRMLGIFSALCISGIMAFGFLQSYQQSKERQVHKIDLVELAIFADKPAGEPILYEAVATEECIKQRTDIIPYAASASAIQTSSISTSAMPVSSFAVAGGGTASLHAASVTLKTNVAGTTKLAVSSKKKPSPPEPRIIPASAPKCIAQADAPAGYKMLGEMGFVTLELNLAKTGRVERGEIEKSSGFTELDAAALKQVTETWKFEPCKKQNIIVACKQSIRFRWEIK